MGAAGSSSSSWTLSTPVALTIFNRPEKTAQVFAEIRRARPPVLLVVADGPRAGIPRDAAACRAARALVEEVDWDCELTIEAAESNLGCRTRMSSGIDWVFSRVERAIVLEDDCLPDPTFFRFCEELLERYRDDERVMSICGTNLYGSDGRGESYWFSPLPRIWGWATWRRAWDHYDVDIRTWPAARTAGVLQDLLPSKDAVAYYTDHFDQAHQGQTESWDYQWLFASLLQNGLNVIPSVNLISNIGFDAEATHTKTGRPEYMLSRTAIDFPLRHPSMIVPEARREAAFFRRMGYSTRRGRLRDAVRRRTSARRASAQR